MGAIAPSGSRAPAFVCCGKVGNGFKVKDSAEDAWLLGAILLMVWGGLRWSDVQRLPFSSLVIDDKSIRGWCWRTKSSKHGMPFGIQTCGVTPAMWGQRYGVMLAECTKAMPERDFLFSTRVATRLRHEAALPTPHHLRYRQWLAPCGPIASRSNLPDRRCFEVGRNASST